MATCDLLANPVNLKTLKISFNRLNPDFPLILKDDIWNKGILILRSGRYLTESIIDKLINFGIDKVHIHLEHDEYDIEEKRAIEEFKGNFMQTQNVLIIDKDFKAAAYLTKKLKNMMFNEENIYLSTDIKVINKYLIDKIPDYLFVNYSRNTESYIKAIREVEVLQNVHIFLIVSPNDNRVDIRELESRIDAYNIKLILKPFMMGHLRNMIYSCVDLDFSRLLRNHNPANSYKQSVNL